MNLADYDALSFDCWVFEVERVRHEVASNAQDLWINLGLAREGRTFPNDPVMVIE